MHDGGGNRDDIGVAARVDDPAVSLQAADSNVDACRAPGAHLG